MYNTKKAITYILFLLLIFRLKQITTYANDTNLGKFGETVRPIENGNVIMESESINVNVEGSTSKTRCIFNFLNDSDEIMTVLMGFPTGDMDKDAEWFYDFKVRNFKVSINDEEIEPLLEEGKVDEPGTEGVLFPYWYTWEVQFKPGERKQVVNTYETTNTSNSMGFVHTGYVLTTGTAWKGNIGKADIVFMLNDTELHQIEHISPGGYRREDNKLIWQFNDFEPSGNIEIMFNVRDKYLVYDLHREKDYFSELFEYIDKNKYEDIVDFTENIDTNDEFEEVFLKINRAKALLNLDINFDEAEKLLINIMEKGEFGSREALFLLVEEYDKHSRDKLSKLYNDHIYLKTNSIIQRFVEEKLFGKYSNDAPEFTNIKTVNGNTNISVLDRNDNLKEISFKAWVGKDDEKVFLYEDTKRISPYVKYIAGNQFWYDYPDDEVIYYRVIAKDFEGNVSSTQVISLEPEKEDRNDHWALKYIKKLERYSEIPYNPVDGDAFIKKDDFVNLVIKNFHERNPFNLVKESDVLFEKFEGRSYISREEAVDVIMGFIEKGNYEYDEPDFPDAAKVSDECIDSIAFAVEYGFLIGDGRYIKPKDNITINETAAILSRIGYSYLSPERYKRISPEILNIVFSDKEAYSWYLEKAGRKLAGFEDGYWYILESDGTGMYKQKASEELAVEVLSSFPEIYEEKKESGAVIHILQKLGTKPHRYSLTLDPDHKIIKREILDY